MVARQLFGRGEVRLAGEQFAINLVGDHVEKERIKAIGYMAVKNC